MNAITPVKYTTPDGVERELRATLGARKRIAARFKQSDVMKIVSQFGDGSLPEIAYALMYDSKGNPPQGLDVVEFAESLDTEDATDLFAHILSAFQRGRTSPNEIAEALKVILEEADLLTAMMTSIGSTSLASAESASA